jgi:hypothetical protein
MFGSESPEITGLSSSPTQAKRRRNDVRLQEDMEEALVAGKVQAPESMPEYEEDEGVQGEEEEEDNCHDPEDADDNIEMTYMVFRDNLASMEDKMIDILDQVLCDCRSSTACVWNKHWSERDCAMSSFSSASMSFPRSTRNCETCTGTRPCRPLKVSRLSGLKIFPSSSL